MSTVAFALSLTALMAVTLFVAVGVNPKTEGYGHLPWYYAGGCLVASAVLNALSRRYGKPSACVGVENDK